jgi:hypothetical protein
MYHTDQDLEQLGRMIRPRPRVEGIDWALAVQGMRADRIRVSRERHAAAVEGVAALMRRAAAKREGRDV